MFLVYLVGGCPLPGGIGGPGFPPFPPSTAGSPTLPSYASKHLRTPAPPHTYVQHLCSASLAHHRRRLTNSVPPPGTKPHHIKLPADLPKSMESPLPPVGLPPSLAGLPLPSHPMNFETRMPILDPLRKVCDAEMNRHWLLENLSILSYRYPIDVCIKFKRN